MATQRQELHGPPAYFTPDWFAAARSVRALAALDPSVLVTGHGIPMGGPRLHKALLRLADRFEADEIPRMAVISAAPRWQTIAEPCGCRPIRFPRALARMAVPVALGAVALLAMRRRRPHQQTQRARRPRYLTGGRGPCQRPSFARYLVPVAIAPPPDTHEFQPPSNARLLTPTPFSMSAPRALVCSSTQAQ